MQRSILFGAITLAVTASCKQPGPRALWWRALRARILRNALASELEALGIHTFHRMDELQRQAAEVRSLGEAPPSPERWTALHAALHSKFEGTQSLALRVLGRWGGPDAVAALRQFLSEAYHRPYSWAIRGVAAEEVAKVATADDVAWILDLYFQLDDALEKHELVRLVIALPPDAARARRALLWPLREDPDGFVRKSAHMLTQDA